jgi:hypothetical protein
VSGSGNDSNPCSNTSPCKTFAGAISKTAAGGEIDALDPGDFGAVTIAHAVTIDGGVSGNIASAGAITIAAGSADIVILRHLSVQGDGTGSGVGISFSSGAGLVLDRVQLEGFHNGVVFGPSASAQLLATEITARANSVSAITVGSTGGTATAAISRSHFDDNGIGVEAIAGAQVGVFDSTITASAVSGVSALGANGSADVNLEEVDLSNNAIAVQALGGSGSAASSTIVRLSQVLMTGNAMQTSESGDGQILTFADNRLDTTPTLTVSPDESTQTVTAGDSATYTATVAFTDGLLQAPIAASCDGLPSTMTCTVTPSMIPNGVDSVDVMVQITTTAPSVNPAGALVVPPIELRFDPRALLGAVLIAGLAALLLPARRRVRRTVILMALLAASCGDNTKPASSTSGTPRGTYQFSLVATTSGVSASAPLQLTVQ